jgi:hypothetical protein
MGRSGWTMMVEFSTDGLYNLTVSTLTRSAVVSSAANTITMTRFPLGRRQQKGFNMIIYIEPVTNIGTISIKRYRLPCKPFENHDWDEFLWKLPRSIIIRTVR